MLLCKAEFIIAYVSPRLVCLKKNVHCIRTFYSCSLNLVMYQLRH